MTSGDPPLFELATYEDAARSVREAHERAIERAFEALQVAETKSERREALRRYNALLMARDGQVKGA